MTREKTEKIARGITDKIECNTADMDDWAEFWGFTREEYEEFIDMAIKASEQEPKWIPVSERLPKPGEYVGNVAKYYLVQNEYGDMLVARYTNSKYWEQIYQTQPIGDQIVAWMPLPSCYQGE